MVSIICTPNILPWLSPEAKEVSLVLLDIEADVLDDFSMRFDLNVVFNCIPVRRGVLQKTTHYIGTTGAQISAECRNATLKGFTAEKTLDVNYKNTDGRTRTRSLTIAPELTITNTSAESSAKIGALQFDAGQQRTFSSMFSSQERLLTVINMGDTLKWVIDLPRGEKAIRDFLIGNLYLFVEFVWNKEVTAASGKLAVRPSDVRFFDAERRPMGKLGSLSMRYTLWRRGIKVQNMDGCETSFRVNI